jgi:hypothetical protein
MIKPHGRTDEERFFAMLSMAKGKDALPPLSS